MRILLPSLLLFLIACQKEASRQADGSLNQTTFSDQPYGPAPLQKIDVYLPAGRTAGKTKAIVLIHGGAWTSGNKSDFADYVDTLKRRLPDYAIFNINYRLGTTSTNLFPTQENDVKLAVDFIVSKAAEYNISQKLVLLGASAGGHLALLEGYKNAPPLKIKAIIDFFGPTDMTEMYNHPASPLILPTIQSLLGGTPATNTELYSQSSPINFVTPQSPPTIIFQGGLDPLVSVSQSTSLETRLQANGVAHQYVFYPTEGHGWSGDNLVNSFNLIEAFLASHVN